MSNKTIYNKYNYSGNQKRTMNKLDGYIAIMKAKFPEFTYVNVMKDDCPEKPMLGDEFTILVRGVPAKKTAEVRLFIHRSIYDKCYDNEPLPCIITLQRRTKENQMRNETCVKCGGSRRWANGSIHSKLCEKCFCDVLCNEEPRKRNKECVMKLAQKDSAGNLFVEVSNIRITYIFAKNREKAKDWSGKDVMRFQAYKDRANGNSLHKGAEYPINGETDFLDIIGELCLLRKAVKKNETNNF